MSLTVLWDKRPIGSLTLVSESSREYSFEYSDRSRAISLSLPIDKREFTPAETRPFFEALLPEGTIREQIASQLRLAASDSYGMLAAIGRDCAGALQIVETQRMSEPPSAEWLSEQQLDALIAELPHRPLGLNPQDGRLRLSLAGVQRKAVLARSQDGAFGLPLHGLASTHILKPDLVDTDYPALATNEFFCMRLARRCGLDVATVELATIAGRRCLIVTRFDRDLDAWPPRRVHQEDLCQALGITPDFKYQQPGWSRPSYRALAELLDAHSPRPGVDRLNGARGALFHFLVGNADAHAKNIGLLHIDYGVRLAPLYDVVCTAAYPQLSTDLALAIGDEHDPASIGITALGDLGFDFGLGATAFEHERRRLSKLVVDEATQLRQEAERDGWFDPVIDRIRTVIAGRAASVDPPE